MQTFVLSLNDQPLGLITGPGEGVYPWQFVWNAPWGQHPILVYTTAHADPGVACIISTELILRDSGSVN